MSSHIIHSSYQLLTEPDYTQVLYILHSELADNTDNTSMDFCHWETWQNYHLFQLQNRVGCGKTESTASNMRWTVSPLTTACRWTCDNKLVNVLVVKHNTCKAYTHRVHVCKIRTLPVISASTQNILNLFLSQMTSSKALTL